MRRAGLSASAELLVNKIFRVRGTASVSVSGVASYGAMGHVPLLDSSMLFITPPRPRTEGHECFETTLCVQRPVILVSYIDGSMTEIAGVAG